MESDEGALRSTVRDGVAPPIVRVLLTGFMGSGKTSVGRELAGYLAWSFRDFDREIEREAGRSVPEIFRDEGEASFRRMEASVGARLLEEEEVVLATGGGWAARKGRLEAVPTGTLSVWLKVSPEVAVRRARLDDVERPLLEGPDPRGRARALLAERKELYAGASVALDSESAPPAELAKQIAKIVRSLNSSVDKD